MKKMFFSVAIAAILLTSCNSAPKDGSASAQDSTAQQSVTDQASTQQATIDVLIKDYLALKNALASDDDNAAATAGQAFADHVSSLDKSTLSAQQATVFNEVAEDLKEHGEHIKDNTGNIKHQREHFATMSQEVYELIKAGEGTGTKLFLTYCPMYNGGKGANWLSETKEIKNPYHGAEMSTCGSVKEELN